MFGARPGERIVIHYVITNSGNGPDTLDVTVTPPPDWRTTVPPQRYVLGPGESASGDAPVTVPGASVSGVYRVALTVAAGRRPLGTADAVIQLLETPGGRRLGPRLKGHDDKVAIALG